MKTESFVIEYRRQVSRQNDAMHFMAVQPVEDEIDDLVTCFQDGVLAPIRPVANDHVGFGTIGFGINANLLQANDLVGFLGGDTQQKFFFVIEPLYPSENSLTARKVWQPGVVR